MIQIVVQIYKFILKMNERSFLFILSRYSVVNSMYLPYYEFITNHNNWI